MAALIEIEGLRLRQDGRLLFDGADLSLDGGGRVVIAGPAGSGKGALARVLIGLVRPEEGSVRVLGEDLQALDDRGLSALRSRLGVVLADTALISNLKVIENVALPLLHHFPEVPAAEALSRARELLDVAGYRGGLWDLPGPLSTFTRRVVMIARAAAARPPVYIFERITYGLFDREAAGVVEVTRRIHGLDPSALMVFFTGSPAELKLIGPTRLIRVSGGRLEEA